MLCLVTQSRLTLWDPVDCSPPDSSVYGGFPGQNTGVGCHALLQRIFPTQRLNLSLLHCRQVLYHLSYQGSPRILEWAAIPFSKGSYWPWNGTGVSCITSRLFYQLSYQGSPTIPESSPTLLHFLIYMTWLSLNHQILVEGPKWDKIPGLSTNPVSTLTPYTTMYVGGVILKP